MRFCKSCYLLSLQIKTVKVSNVSLGAAERDIKEFFSFSGDIEYLEMLRLVVILVPSIIFYFILLWVSSLLYKYAVIMSGLKLHMLPSRIPKEQKLLFFFR